MSIGELSTFWCLLLILFFSHYLKVLLYKSFLVLLGVFQEILFIYLGFFEANVKGTDCLPHLSVFLSFYIERLLLFMLFAFDMCANFISCYFAVQCLPAVEDSWQSLLCIKSYHFQAMTLRLLSYLQTFPICLPLVPFTCLSVLAKTSDTTLSMYGKTILVFFPDFSANDLNFSVFRLVLPVCLLYICGDMSLYH